MYDFDQIDTFYDRKSIPISFLSHGHEIVYALSFTEYGVWLKIEGVCITVTKKIWDMVTVLTFIQSRKALLQKLRTLCFVVRDEGTIYVHKY